MAMASLCLANLGSLRLVNVSLTCVGVSPYAQAFFSLHYGSDFSGDNSQNGDKRDGSDVLQKHVSKLSSGAVQSPVDVPGPEESERNGTNSDAANNHYTSNDYTSNDYISNDDTSNDDTSNDYTNNENANKENAAAHPHASEQDLLYISETISTGPRMNFGVVSLPTIAQRNFKLRVKFWVSSSTNIPAFSLFYDISLDVRNLIPLDRSRPDVDSDTMFGANAIVWTFDGTEYCLRSHLQPRYLERFSKANIPNSAPGHRRVASSTFKHANASVAVKPPSYSVDDARHISSLVVGLRDFDEIKKNASAEIDALSCQSRTPKLVVGIEEHDRLLHSVAKLDKLIARQECANESLESEILARRNAAKQIATIVSDEFPSFQRLSEEKMEIVSSQVPPLHDSLAASIYPQILSRTHAIVSELINAFPITLADNRTGHYCISGIEFPSSIKEILHVCYNETPALHNAGSNPSTLAPTANSSTDAHHTYVSSVDCVNAGLSEIVAVLNILSSVLGVALKYDLSFSGSRSVLIEHLSPQQVVSNNSTTPAAMHVSSTVTYPLFYDTEHSEGFVVAEEHKHPRNVRFERGLALLNRNLSFFVSEIASLYIEYSGDNSNGGGGSLVNNIPVDCADHFLWNLHYVMLFITAPAK